MNKIEKFKWLLESFEQCVEDNCIDKRVEAWEDVKYFKEQIIKMFEDEVRDSNEEMTNKIKELNEEIEWLKDTIDELVVKVEI